MAYSIEFRKTRQHFTMLRRHSRIIQLLCCMYSTINVLETTLVGSQVPELFICMYVFFWQPSSLLFETLFITAKLFPRHVRYEIKMWQERWVLVELYGIWAVSYYWLLYWWGRTFIKQRILQAPNKSVTHRALGSIGQREQWLFYVNCAEND